MPLDEVLWGDGLGLVERAEMMVRSDEMSAWAGFQNWDMEGAYF